MKRQPTEWEKIFANVMTNNGLITKIYKQLIQLNIKKKWAEGWKDFSKADRQTATGPWKDVPIANRQRNANQKSQWDGNSHLSEWLSLKCLQVTNAGEDVEKNET